MTINIPTDDSEEALARFKAEMQSATREERLAVTVELSKRLTGVVHDFIEGVYDNLDKRLEGDVASQAETESFLKRL